jgi:hypothetical protein
MRFVIEYRLIGGSRGIMLFTEDNEIKAAEYVADMICRYGYAYVSDPIILSGGIEELYRVTATFDEKWKMLSGKACNICF